ncbi:MAG: flavodoxin domain-containing protein [Patescibacteria group bacterium]
MSKKIIIIYASNSGSTFLVGEIIAHILGRKHQVVMQKAADTSPDDLLKYDIFILGSPSWSTPGLGEGFPQETMLAFIKSCAGLDLSGKQCVAFGCGDSSYTLFCGAVNQLEKFMADLKGTRLINSLRVDGYFFDLPKNIALVKKWAQALLAHIS